MGKKVKKKIKPLSWLIMLIGFIAMLAFVVIQFDIFKIEFLSFMVDEVPKDGGEASMNILRIIIGAAGVLLFVFGFLTKTKKVKK